MNYRNNGGARVIAVCGKGGVGKTSISAMIVKILLENPENRVLAIDADPAVGLAVALNIDVVKTVDDIRNDLILRMKNGGAGDKAQIASLLDYEMLSAIKEDRNLAFLAIGRPEKEGCFCQVNRLLKEIIASVADNFDYVVIDGEAGIEQVNRRVMERVSHLILVSDASARSLRVVASIKKVSNAFVDYEKVGLILNRIRQEQEIGKISIKPDLNYIGWIPEDNAIRQCDIEGGSILDLPKCEAYRAAENCLAELELFVSKQRKKMV